MQIAPEQGAFMALLVRAIGARRCLEVGTFTGYSSTEVALALPPGGQVVCCDVSREWTDIAREAWAEAGVADRVELRLGPALETLDTFLADGAAGSFDFAFIDADKPNYDGYVERALRLQATGQVDLHSMISHRVPLEEWKVAFDALESGEAIKALIFPNGVEG